VTGFDPEYMEEMRGIAEGARVPLEGVVTVNCRTEMMFGFKEAAHVHEKMEDGCTGVVALPSVTASGRLLHAHNWDWRQEAADSSIVLRVRSENGPDILTLVEAGGLARHGFNRRRGAHRQLPRLRPRLRSPASLWGSCGARSSSSQPRRRGEGAGHLAAPAPTTSCCRRPTAKPSTSSACLTRCSGSSPRRFAGASNHFISPAARARITDTYFPRRPTRSTADPGARLPAARRGRID
jgi:hypothetical protein